MATTTEEDCLPPTEFVVSIILPGLSSAMPFVSTLKSANWFCPTCWRTTADLNCPKCVVDINKLDGKQILSENLHRTRRNLIESIENRVKIFSERCEIDLQKFKIERQIAVVKSLMALRRENISTKKARFESAMKQIEVKRRILINVRKSVEIQQKWAENLEKSKEKRLEALEKRRKHLILVRQQTAADLFRHIFPLDTVAVTSDASKTSTSTTLSDQSLSIEVVDALSEATLTNFCHDRWIFMGRQAEIQYRLVHSCTIGDYSDYLPLAGWLFSRQTDVPMTDSLFSNKSAQGALSALAYLTQLTSILSRIFDAPLPFKFIFVNFYDEKLTEDEFETLNLKLNANVAYLCSSQGLSSDCVCLTRPFWNMFNFLNNVDTLGVGGEKAYTVDALFARDFRRAAAQVTWKECAPAVAEPPDEWENVNEQLPEWTGTASSPPTLTQFFTSATTSVANLFKHGT